MKTIGLLLAVLLLPLAAPAADAQLEGGVNPGYHEPPAWFKHSFLDLGEDLAEATTDGKRLLLYFYQDGCPYCAKLLQDNFGQHAIAERTRQSYDVIALNIWGDREVTTPDGAVMTEKEFAASQRVMFTPTLLFLDEGGGQVLRVNGYYAPHRFSAALEYAARGGPAEGTSFAEYVAAEAGEPAGGELNQRSWFMRPPFALARNRMPASRPMLVLFEQRECAACDEFHRDILAAAGSEQLMRQFDVVQIDMQSTVSVITPDGQRMTAAEWARALDVQYAPTLAFFDEQGREVFRTEAYLRTFHVQSALEYVLSGAYRTEPNFQRFVQARADRLHDAGVEYDLME